MEPNQSQESSRKSMDTSKLLSKEGEIVTEGDHVGLLTTDNGSSKDDKKLNEDLSVTVNGVKMVNQGNNVPVASGLAHLSPRTRNKLIHLRENQEIKLEVEKLLLSGGKDFDIAVMEVKQRYQEK